MSVPQPPQALEGHCSAINNDILYVLSPSSFQSLPLQKNATWSDAPTGQLVTGHACVTAGPADDPSQAALYVIGGTSEDSSYGGLQRYFFGNKTWETLSPAADVLKGRTNHSAAYLSDSRKILVYAGSQSDTSSFLSSQTFLISTEPPYNVQSFTSKAPPANVPILQPWNSSHAVMLGGTPLSTDVFTFGPVAGWRKFDTTLTTPLGSSVRGTIIDGSDGSKILQVYDVTVSPNEVSSIVLLDADGKPAITGEVAGQGASTRKRKRDLRLNDWPSYNSTGAPTATRTDCSLAQGSNGLAVIAGGSSDTPVALFDESVNSWVNANTFFDSKVQQQQPLQQVPTTASASSSTSPPSSSAVGPAPSTGNPAGGLSPHERMLRSLGIALGIIFGIAAILILLLLLLRWRRTKQKRKQGYVDNEKDVDRMSFADRGVSFMKEAEGSVTDLTPPTNRHHESGTGSYTSLSIIGGRFGKRRTSANAPKASSESTTRLVKDISGAPAGSEQVEMVSIATAQSSPIRGKKVARSEHTPPAAVTYGQAGAVGYDRNRSSGWSKFFAANNSADPKGPSQAPETTKREHVMSNNSQYSNGRPSPPSRIPSSVLMPPLDIDFSKTIDGQRLSHVASGSPLFSDSREDLARRGSVPNIGEGQRGQIVNPTQRPRSSGDISGRTLSSYLNPSARSSNVTGDYASDSDNTPWTPVSSHNFRDHLNPRPASSNYTASVYDSLAPPMPSRGKGAGFFPGAGTVYRPPSKPKLSHSAGPSCDSTSPHALGNGGITNGLTVPKPFRVAEDRDSNVTVFPGAVPVFSQTNGLTIAKPSLTTSSGSRNDSKSALPVEGSTLYNPFHTQSSPACADSSLQPPPQRLGDPHDSTVTLFPRGVPSTNDAEHDKENAGPPVGKQDGQAAQMSGPSTLKSMIPDMSWLNLGLGTSSPVKS